MQPLRVAILSTTALTMSASARPAFAQRAVIPGKPSGTPVATTVGPVSPQTGYSKGDRGGTGGDGAGTAIGRNPSG